MVDSDTTPSPGRHMELTPEDVVDEIREAGIPLTAKMIADRVGKSKRTVYNRIEEMEESGEYPLEEIEYGNATAYFLEEPKLTVQSSLAGGIDTPFLRALRPGNIIGMVFFLSIIIAFAFSPYLQVTNWPIAILDYLIAFVITAAVTAVAVFIIGFLWSLAIAPPGNRVRWAFENMLAKIHYETWMWAFRARGR